MLSPLAPLPLLLLLLPRRVQRPPPLLPQSHMGCPQLEPPRQQVRL